MWLSQGQRGPFTPFQGQPTISGRANIPGTGTQKSWLLSGAEGPRSGADLLSTQYPRPPSPLGSDDQIPGISLNDSSQMVPYSFSQGYAICCPNYWISSLLTKRN